MSSTIVVKLLVAGLAMYVPGDDGEMRVLLPEVHHHLGGTVPEHVTWFGYWQENGETSCLAGFEDHTQARRRGPTEKQLPTLESGRLCWRRLDRAAIWLPSRTGFAEPDRGPRDNFLRLYAKLPKVRNPKEIRDLTWLGEFDRIDPSFRIRPELLNPPGNRCPAGLSAYMRFQSTRRAPCRLAGRIDPATQSFQIATFGFKAPGSNGGFRRRQALATSVEFDVEVAGPNAEITIWPMEGEAIPMVLSPQRFAGTEAVYVALIHESLVSEAAAGGAPSRMDHLQAYADLAEFPGLEPPTMEARFEAGKGLFSPVALEAQCRSPFLRPLNEVAAQAAIVAAQVGAFPATGEEIEDFNEVALTPTSDLAGPPLCPGVRASGSG